MEEAGAAAFAMMEKAENSPESAGSKARSDPDNSSENKEKMVMKYQGLEKHGEDGREADGGRVDANDRKVVKRKREEEHQTDHSSDDDHHQLGTTTGDHDQKQIGAPPGGGSTRSEKKRHREKIRRSELNLGLDALASLLYTIEPSLKQTGAGPSVYPGKRKAGEAPGESQTAISNRVDLINCAVEILKRIHGENESRKVFIAEVTGCEPGADDHLKGGGKMKNSLTVNVRGADPLNRAGGSAALSAADLGATRSSPFPPTGSAQNHVGSSLPGGELGLGRSSVADQLQLAAAANQFALSPSPAFPPSLSRLLHPSLSAGEGLLGGHFSALGGADMAGPPIDANMLALLQSRGLPATRRDPLALLRRQHELLQSSAAAASLQGLGGLSGLGASSQQNDVAAMLASTGLPLETSRSLLQQGVSLAEIRQLGAAARAREAAAMAPAGSVAPDRAGSGRAGADQAANVEEAYRNLLARGAR